MHRIGYLAGGPPGCPPTTPSRAFRQGLLDAGYVEGRDVILDRRCVPTNDLAGQIVDDVLKATPHILLAAGGIPALAMKARAPHLPVVFVDVPDPVGAGLVQSLARPGTNMTGLSNFAGDLNGKRVQLLKEALPAVRVVSTLSISDDSPLTLGMDRFRGEVDQAGTTAGWQMRHFTVRSASDLPGAFHAMRKDGAQAFIVMPGVLFWAERARIASLAAQHRLPGMYMFRAQVEAGGFISYGADQADLYRRAASYVVKILRGARPGDLPVEEPTKFELAVNLKTAKALGLTIPQGVLLRADHVIE
jgi:putative ABC transport system substrate-binding protein